MLSFPIHFAALMYVITGGPSSGKTSIIEELEKQGEAVIHEAAVDCISRKMSSGILEPWKEDCFSLDIVKLQFERENPYRSFNGRVFIDRGVFDVYAYAMEHGLAGTETLTCLNEMLKPIDLNQRYRAVFFVSPHDEVNFSPLQTELRRENAQEAAKLAVATYAIYCRHDRFIIVPGGLSPRDRADFILKKIRQMEHPD